MPTILQARPATRSTTEIDDAAVLLPDRLDTHKIEMLEHQLRQLELGRGDRIAFDGARVDHADLAGLRFLVRAQAQCEEIGASVRLAQPSLALRLAIEFTGITGTPAENHASTSTDSLAEVA